MHKRNSSSSSSSSSFSHYTPFIHDAENFESIIKSITYHTEQFDHLSNELKDKNGSNRLGNSNTVLIWELSFGIGTILFEDGHIYEGGIRGFQMHGYGVLVWRYFGEFSGKYEGGFYKNVPHCQGKYTSFNHQQFSGEFDYGVLKNIIKIDWYLNRFEGNLIWRKLEGVGLHLKSNGAVYDGNFKNGQYDGNGNYHSILWNKMIKYRNLAPCFPQNWNCFQDVLNCSESNSMRILIRKIKSYLKNAPYEGEWKNGKKHGFGTVHFGGGNSYSGDWRKGFFYGLGKWCLADGSCFAGFLDEEMFTGAYVRQLTGAREERGWWVKREFLNSILNSVFWEQQSLKEESKRGFHVDEGVRIFEDGSVIVGKYIDGKENGKHKYIDSLGIKLIFKYKLGKLKLTRQIVNLQKPKEDYIWTNNWLYSEYSKSKHKRLNGEHNIIFEDGNTYKGNWKNGDYNGYGELTALNRYHYWGEFKDDEFDGKGVYESAEGWKYDGQFKEGKRHGKGRLEDTDGRIYDGHWKNNKKFGFGVMAYPDGTAFRGYWGYEIFEGIQKSNINTGGLHKGSWIVCDQEYFLPKNYDQKSGISSSKSEFIKESQTGKVEWFEDGTMMIGDYCDGK